MDNKKAIEVLKNMRQSYTSISQEIQSLDHAINQLEEKTDPIDIFKTGDHIRGPKIFAPKEDKPDLVQMVKNNASGNNIPYQEYTCRLEMAERIMQIEEIIRRLP